MSGTASDTGVDDCLPLFKKENRCCSLETSQHFRGIKSPTSPTFGACPLPRSQSVAQEGSPGDRSSSSCEAPGRPQSLPGKRLQAPQGGRSPWVPLWSLTCSCRTPARFPHHGVSPDPPTLTFCCMMLSLLLHGLKRLPCPPEATPDRGPALSGQKDQAMLGPQGLPTVCLEILPEGLVDITSSQDQLLLLGVTSQSLIHESPSCFREARTCGKEKPFNIARSSTVDPEPMPPGQGPCGPVLSHLLIQYGASGFRASLDFFISPFPASTPSCLSLAPLP